MKTSLNSCPVCEADLFVTEYHCEICDTRVAGRFESSTFPGLTPEQLEFIRTFVRCEGKFTRMEVELRFSYPTIRNRLQDIIRAMGFDPKRDDADMAASKRRTMLDDLEAGRITVEEAMRES